MLKKSLIQFSVEGWGCVPSLLFDLRPNYGGGNEDSGNEEVGLLRQQAQDLGITIYTDGSRIPDVGIVDVEGNAQFPASSRIFLQPAMKNGGWLCLKGLEKEDMEALMAFSERYWRGGDVGDGTQNGGLPVALSTAGSRLANFMEKIAVHRQRFQ